MYNSSVYEGTLRKNNTAGIKHGVRYVGNSFENFEEDDLVLLGPDLPHCWKNIAPLKDKAGAIVFHWRADLLGENWMQKKEFKAIQKISGLAVKGIQFEKSFARVIKNKLIHSLHSSPFNKLISLLSILNELGNTKHYRILSSDRLNDTRSGDHERIKTIYNYVEKNFDSKITLTAIAASIHLSEESFSRFFSKVMGKPFFYFLNEYRIGISCEKLINSSEQVVHIAYSCGFESLPFFHRQFKKYKGCSPGDFRKAYYLME